MVLGCVRGGISSYRLAWDSRSDALEYTDVGEVAIPVVSKCVGRVVIIGRGRPASALPMLLFAKSPPELDMGSEIL